MEISTGKGAGRGMKDKAVAKGDRRKKTKKRGSLKGEKAGADPKGVRGG